MRRRHFLAFVGAASVWPLATRAQQGERMRRIGIVGGVAADNPDAQALLAALLKGLQQLGWVDGRNVRIEIRWTAANRAKARQCAELVAFEPDVIFASGGSVLGPLLEASRTVPIVFTRVADPVAAGFVDSLARPGGNATGFMQFEYSLCGKWLALLKEIAPSVKRAAVLRDSAITAGIGQFAIIQSVAPSVGVDVSLINLGEAAEIERAVAAFAQSASANGGLILTASGLAVVHRDLIIALAARHRLPAVYYEPHFVAAGGLISYGPNFLDEVQPAVGYIDRILRGAKPAELPVQAQTKYELVVNLKTAKGLGLVFPQAVLVRADQVIE